MPDTPELRAEVAGVVAVCARLSGRDAAGYAVWHVGVLPGDTVPRLRGAWVVADDVSVAPLVRGRTAWVLTAGAHHAVVEHAAGVLDAAATDAAVHTAISAWDAAFAAEVARSRRALKRPEWGVTAELHSAELHTADHADTADTADGIPAVLAAARRLETLARQWSTAQTRRVTRDFLRSEDLGGDSAASLPLITV